MSAVIVVSYPRGANFQKQPYLDKHLPLVLEHWKKLGVRSWKVVIPEDPACPYEMIGYTYWDTMADAKTIVSLDEDVMEKLKDFSYYSDQPPIVWFADVLTEGSLPASAS